eukprot:c20600_g1_i1 orf=802-6423(+)
MDDSWQLRGTNRPSSQWVNWQQGPMNQIDMSAGRYPSPYITQEICVIERTVRQEPAYPNMLSLNSQSLHSRAGKPLAPHPMIAMTQENLQQFQSDFQQTPIPRTSYVSSNQPWYSTNSSDGGAWPMMTSANPPFMGKVGALANPAIMADFSQGAQGEDLSQLARGGGAGKFDTVISRPGSVEMYKQTLSVNSHLGEMDLQPQYQLPPWQSDKRSSMYITPLLHRSSSQPVVDASLGLIKEQAHRKPLLRPRVLCASISGSPLGGELTMSEAGLLGVICSCHGSHMSVAKFCEHCGLFGVNPGSSVLMEGGESLAQWRRTFFSQYRVKVPEDHVGWEWDELNGAESGSFTHREVHTQGLHKEADPFLQGDSTLLKNRASLHSSMGQGSSNISRRSAGMGLIHGNTSQSRSQDMGSIESTVVEKSYRGFTGMDFGENQAFSQKPYDIANKNQGSNSTHLFWGNEVGVSPVTEHANFPKAGSQSSKHVIENSSAFNGGGLKKVMELCRGRYSAQDMEQVDNEMATSNFELRLGQPNLSLGSIYSNPLQSRGSCGPLSQAKPATHEMANQTAWEQNCHQSADHSGMGRPVTLSVYMGQSNEGTYITNWLSNNQKNRDFGMPQMSSENDKQLGGFHQMHAQTFPDVHTLQMFPSMRKHAEDADVPYVEGSFHSGIIMQPSENRNVSEQRRMELSSSEYSTSTTLNAYQNDSAKEAGINSQCHQSSASLIRPTAKNSEGIRNVEGMFMTPLERPRPLMPPPETNASASEASAMKSSMIQTAGPRSGACASWAKQVSGLAISESLSSCGPTKLQERINSTMVCQKVNEVRTQQDLMVQTKNDHLAEEAGLCPLGASTVNACTTLAHTSEGSRDHENQGIHQENDLFRTSHDTEIMITNPHCIDTDSGLKFNKSVPHAGSLVVEEGSPSETPGEAFSDPMVTKYSTSEKCCLSDEALPKSDVDAQADSVGVEVTTQESPLSFRSPDRLGKPLVDGSSVNAKLEEKRSSRNLCRTVESTAKELVRNDVLDEGSGIGKCCSSIEADMEAMTSTGPVSSHAYVQVLESQTSMANSSSSNAVISDTLSNSVRVRKLFMEVDKSTTATQNEAKYEAGKSMQRTDKRGRKTLKWKCLDVHSGEGKERFSRVEDRGLVGVSRKTLASDDTDWVPNPKGLKRKRSALNSGPDLTSSNVATVFNEGSSRGVDEVEHALKRRGTKHVFRPPEETFAKQIMETNLFNNEKLLGKSKRGKYQDLTSTYSINACSGLKTNSALGKEKLKNLSMSGSTMKNGRGISDRPELKAVKMASLSSILEVPKAGAAFQSKKASDIHSDISFNPLPSKISQSKFRQVKGLPVGGAPDVFAHPKGGVDDSSLTKLEGWKRSSWEMTARPNQQNKVSVSQTMAPAGKRMAVSQASEFEGTMVTVPLKFIPAKRLAPEALRKETKGLSISTVDHGNLSSGLVKRLRSQAAHAAHAKTVPFSPMLHTENKGFASNDDEDEVKPVRKRRKRRRRSKSTIKSKNKQPMICCICGESSVQKNNVIVKCSRCGLGVHQACYGVTEVTRKPWICRPCKAHATNIVCVLCGYGDGAMTRAKKSGALAKGLLQAWQDEDATKGVERLNPNVFARSNAVDIDQSRSNPSQHDCRNGQSDCKLYDVPKKDEEGTGHLREECKVGRNSVADGINDPTVTQWVHVVCALWMPGTRCINVETMAAFDVSGVASAPRKWVCSICKRPGGACIKCRVPKCATPFHPWCAHGKGLLQNEAFGGEDDKVGFFGKCLLHGNLTNECLEEAPVTEPAAAVSQYNNATCARTEGGYTRGETSFKKKVIDPTSLGVLQEDVTAWLSKKEHRRSSRRFIKLANSDVKTHHRANLFLNAIITGVCPI